MAECKSIAQFNLESQPDCIRVFPFENPSGINDICLSPFRFYTFRLLCSRLLPLR